MRTFYCAALILVSWIAPGIVLRAASPVGTLSTLGAVVVSGAELSASAVTVWPIVAGDDIATRETPAVLMVNGSRITLSANSKAKITSDKGRVMVSLLTGFLNYTIAAAGNLTVRSQGRMVDTGSGSLDSKGGEVPVQSLQFAPAVVRAPVKASNSF
jgi:hypothetical protein